MRKLMIGVVAGLALLAGSAFAESVVCEEAGPLHLQGVASDGEAIYWCFTTRLVKTDMSGRTLLAVDVPNHSGDLCVHCGKVYVATGREAGESGEIQEVRLYDAQSLAFVKSYKLNGLCDPNGLTLSSIDYANERFFLAMGHEEPSSQDKNYVLEVTPSFGFVKRHELATGHSEYGLQTIAWHNGQFVIGTYKGTGVTKNGLVCDAEFKMAVPADLPAYEGVMSVTGVLYTATSKQDGQTGRWVATATSVERGDYLANAVSGASGELVATPVTLQGFGFLPTSRYFGGADQTTTGTGTEACNLIANACPRGGDVITLNRGDAPYAGGIAVASGTLAVPEASSLALPSGAEAGAPIVLSEGTLRIGESGSFSRDIAVYPMNGCLTQAAVMEVPDEVSVTATGRLTTPGRDIGGNLLKTGGGTFVLKTAGDASVTNSIGSNGKHGTLFRTVCTVGEKGDGPTAGCGAFSVANGRFVIDTDPDVTTELGNETWVGGETTREPGAETAGHLDILRGHVRCLGWLAVGRQNGTTNTAPQGLRSTIDVYAADVTCQNFAMGYAEVPNAAYTHVPELTIHKGGSLAVANDFRLDHEQSRGVITVDGGVLTMNRFLGAYYYAGSHYAVNVCSGGVFRANTFMPARYSSVEKPTSFRIRVTDGGRLAIPGVSHQTSVAADGGILFDGGTLEAHQRAYSDAIQDYMPVEVGDRGMTLDVSDCRYWGLRFSAPIMAASGATAAALSIVNTNATTVQWVRFVGGVELPGGITARRTSLLFGCDIDSSVALEDAEAGIRATADVTVDSISYAGGAGTFDCGFTGDATNAGVRAYVLTANVFVPPAGGKLKVTMIKGDSTTWSQPYGTFPFVRVPVSSALRASHFVSRHASTATDFYRFLESEANGWRTISLQHVAVASATAVDPRTGDWTSGCDKVVKIGPWLCNVAAGGETVCANYLLGDKPKDRAGGFDVTGNLLLTGGAFIGKGSFVKLGSGTLTLGGNAVYSFGREYIGTAPGADPAVWNLFDADGNAVNAHSAGLIVDAGTLQIGTGSDSPTVTYPSANELWIGSVCSSSACVEADAKLVMQSGSLSLNGIVIGRNRGNAASSVHDPLKSEYVQNGGTVSVKTLTVGFDGQCGSLQQDSFVLNGGTFEALKWGYVGKYSTKNSRGCSASMTINGGRFEIGRDYYATSDDGRLLLSLVAAPNALASFEMNGGEAVLWKGFACWNASGDANRTQVRLNGGTIRFCKPVFDGGNYSELHWNGTVLRPVVTEHVETIGGTTFRYFNVREIGAKGAVFDLSEADVDAWDLTSGFSGTGDLIVRGGNTNRALRVCKQQTTTGDFIAEDGGVIQVWHDNYDTINADKTVRVRRGGGVADYYGRAIKELYLGESADDASFVYGYGYAGHYPIVAGTKLELKGTVYCAYRISGAGNALLVPAGTNPVLRGPKGSFADVDVATQFKVHPALEAVAGPVTFAIDTSNASYDQVKMTCAWAASTNPNLISAPAYPGRVTLDGSYKFSGTAQRVGADGRSGTPNSNAGTVEVTGPIGAGGTVKLQYGRIEGRPEHFDNLTLDLNNASVRFTESGTTTANLLNTTGGATGLGLEVAEGKTVYVTGILSNKSALVKLDPGTLVLQGSRGDFTLAGRDDRYPTEPWTTANVPVNGNVPYAASLAVNAGTLVFDMPGTVLVSNAANKAYAWIGSHFIPDGSGGAYPAILEQRQGTLVVPYEFAVGRHVDTTWDDHSKFTKRPYTAYNLYGGLAQLNGGLIMGYNNYKDLNCAQYEVNVYGGRLEVGGGLFSIGWSGSNVKINGEENESVVNVYGGTLARTGDVFVGSRWSAAGKACRANGTIHTYGGEFLVTGTVNVPQYEGGRGKVYLHGGLLEAKNIVRYSTAKETEGYVNFDGGTFRPLADKAKLSGFTRVTVGAGGGVIDVPKGNGYAVAQKLERAAALGTAPDGGFKACGAGVLTLDVANDFTGPVGAADSATLKQGVAGAFSDTAVLEGGTLDLNGIDTTFRSVRGYGRIVGNCTVTEEIALDGELVFEGDLSLAAGAMVRMKLEDDGAATDDRLTVTGALTAASTVGFDLGRPYDDTGLAQAFRTVVGSAGKGSDFKGELVNTATGRCESFVGLVGGDIVIRTSRRGSTIVVR